MAECVRRLRGLPYEATVPDIREWLKDYQVVDHGIDIQVNANGCPMGQAWVEFVSADVAAAAQTNMHKQHMGSRYIEVLPAQPSDLLERGKQRSVLSTTPSGPSVVKLRGLPWGADETQVLKFIGASSLPQQHATIVRNSRGRSTGEAFVQLPSDFNRASVMRKHNTKMDGRTIDITPSTVEEMRVYVSAMADPRHAEPAPRSPGNNVSPHTLWLRGMPFTCTESDVANFFCGLNIRRRGISLFQDYYGELTGEAVVQFETAADLAAARLREKQFMQNRFIEWQRQPSCNPERLGRIFTNNDPMYRLSWERGEQPHPEDEYTEGYDDSAYPESYGYPYPPHPHDGSGYDYPPYPPMYPHQQPHPQSYYPPAYAGGHYDQSGAVGGPHQMHSHGGYPPAGYSGYGPQHPQHMYPGAPPPPHYTNAGYPPHGYPPHPSYPPHYGAYPPHMYGGEQGGYWGEQDQQYEGGVAAEEQGADGTQQVTGVEGQERGVEGTEEEAAGSEEVEGTLSGQSSVEGISEHTSTPAGPKQGEKQQEKSQATPPTAPATQQQKTSYPSSAPNNNGTYRGTYAQHARHGGPPRGRGGYSNNNAGSQQRYSRN